MRKSIILEKIAEEEEKLHEQDVEGHIWWNKFRNFIQELEDPDEQKQIDIDVKNLTKKDDIYVFKKK